MKKILTMLLFSVPVIAIAQNNQGEIHYVEKRKLNITFDSAEASHMKAMIPQEDITQTILLFAPEASFYQQDQASKSDHTIDQDDNGGHIMIKMQKPDNKYYRDLKNNKFIQQREFMTRKFLINSDIGKSGWKLTGNQKKILDYPCMEATRTDDDRKITAWFTSAIPVSTGPSQYGNLPGLILETDINDGELIITATDVTLKNIDPKLLTKPTEGKKVSEDEFKKIVAEKTKEMKQQYGGKGNVIIKIDHDDNQ